MKARLLQDNRDLAEKREHLTGAFLDDGVETKGANQSAQHRSQNEHSDECEQKSCEKHYFFTSKIARPACLYNFKRTLRRYAGSALAPCRFNSLNCVATARSGSTSACACKVSISTARLLCTIF